MACMTQDQRRKILIASGALLVAPLPSMVQSAQRTPRIGFLSPTMRGSRNEAFVQGLRELGYVVGTDIHVDMRFSDGRAERLDALAQELIRLKVDVLVVGGTIGARAAMRTTTTVPIVFAGSGDPIAGGIVANLARPQGNITGFSLAYGDGFAGKWLELLKEAASGVTHYAALWSSSNAAAAGFVKELQAAARALHAKLDAHLASNVSELEHALAAIGASGARGMVVTPSPFAVTQLDRYVQFASDKRLPTMYFAEEFVDAGGLMSYGPSIADSYRRAASYVDKILKGAMPADLPVQQPTIFDFVLNLKTARKLELKIPQSTLIRASRIVE